MEQCDIAVKKAASFFRYMTKYDKRYGNSLSPVYPIDSIFNFIRITHDLSVMFNYVAKLMIYYFILSKNTIHLVFISEKS